MKRKMKKTVLIITLTMFCYLSLFILPQAKLKEINAIGFAIPAGAGVYALAALAGAGLLYGLGKSGEADKIVEHAQNVWEKTSSSFKNAITGAWSWVDGQIDGINNATNYKNMKFDLPLLSTADLARLNLSVNEVMTESIKSGVGTKIDEPTFKTAYPDLSFHVANSSTATYSIKNNENVNVFFAVETGNEIRYFKTLEFSGNGFYPRDIYGHFVKQPYSKSIMKIGNFNIPSGVYYTIEHPTIYNVFGNEVLYDFFAGAAVSLESLTNAINRTMQYHSIYLVDESFVYEHHATQSWENLRNNQIVINGDSIAHANPDIDFTNNLDVTDIAFPIPIPNATTGTITVPVAGGTTDALTGETVTSGEGTIPGTEDGGILQGLWDWLKGILQSILDSIKALAGLLGILALLEGIKSLISSVVSGIGTLVDSITTGLVGKAEDIKWEKLKMSGTYFTTKFPFSLPWDVGRALAAVFGDFFTDEVPSWTLKIKDWEQKITFPSVMVNWMPYLKTMILVMFDITLIYSVRKLLGGAQ